MMTDAERELLALIIGHQVRDSRKHQGLSQLELSQGIGSQSMLSLIESGHQLPLPDVLHLIATRLGDATLLKYAAMLEEGRVSFDDISFTNETAMLDALRTQRGRWQDVYGKVAIQLCEHHYANRLFGTVREICQLIHRHSESASYLAQAYFYLGSSYLAENDYQEAEPWLRKAATLENHLPGSMQGRLLYNLAYLYTTLDVQGMAMWYAKVASEKFAELHDFPRHAKSLGLLGTIQHLLGLFEDALESLELSQEISNKWETNPMDAARVVSTLAAAYMELGQLPVAEAWVAKAIEMATFCDDKLTLCDAYRTLYFIHKSKGDTEKAKLALNEAIRMANSSDVISYFAHTYLLAVNHLPDVASKIKAAERAYEVASMATSLIEKAFAAECLAKLHEQEGRSEMAHHYRKMALQAYRHHAQKNSMFKYLVQFLPCWSDS